MVIGLWWGSDITCDRMWCKQLMGSTNQHSCVCGIFFNTFRHSKLSEEDRNKYSIGSCVYTSILQLIDVYTQFDKPPSSYFLTFKGFEFYLAHDHSMRKEKVEKIIRNAHMWHWWPKAPCMNSHSKARMCTIYGIWSSHLLFGIMQCYNFLV